MHILVWRTLHLCTVYVFFCVLHVQVRCFPVYTSCNDVSQKLGSNATDGDYVIYPKNRKFGLTIYCAGFSSGNPKEYLTLHSGRSDNFASLYDYIGSETSCGDKSPKVLANLHGRTEFLKVRFDINQFKIIQDDFTFTHQIGPTPARFATAGDNFASSSKCQPRGVFKVNLVGTPFIVSNSVQWMWTGKFYHTDNSSSSHNAQIFKSKYIGCYTDKTDRLLPSLYFEDNAMTQGKCVEHCRSRGFRYAGLQYFTQCYCGDTCCKFGKVKETECNTPCRGDKSQICGGHWRIGLFSTGDPQSVLGRCGGYPGRCYPAVNGMEGLTLEVVSRHTCLHDPPICQNEAKCIALTATEHKCQCYEGYSEWDCSVINEKVMVGGTKCPSGFQPESCSCGSTCSGAKFEADVCITDSGNPKVTCRFGNPGHVILFNVQGIGTVQCPNGSQITGCTYWDSAGKLKTSDGKANVIRYSSGSCSMVPSCQTCQLQARCKKYDCGCLNGGHCHKVTGQCICKDGYYGDKCESFDYCGFYEDTYNKSACGPGGICTAVPQQQIATHGGDNAGDTCNLPFNFQNNLYGYCVESNEVGPPFACGVKFDGSESSYIDLGPWSPGPVYTLAAWVRPTAAGKTRRTIVGGTALCRDFGFYYFENFWAFYKGNDYGCSRGIDSGVTVKNGQWYLVATTNNGTHVTVYVNGHTNVVKVKPYLLPTTYGFWIGGEQCCKVGRTKGMIKTVKVWKRALSTTEISNSMKNFGNSNSSQEALTSGLVGHWELGETIAPPCVGTDHGGQDWIMNRNSISWGVHCNISRFVVPSGAAVSLSYWNGTKSTGTLEIYAKKIEIHGFIYGYERGYSGGASPTGAGDSGIQGESYTGSGTTLNTKNNGGGGGGVGGNGRSDKRGQPGGGGGYGTTGTLPTKLKGGHTGLGQPGAVYGSDTLKPMYMGSGGGSGGNAADLTKNPKGGKGGNGGGAVTLVAETSVIITGFINVGGGMGQGDSSPNHKSRGCAGCPESCSQKNVDGCRGDNSSACWDESGPGGGGSGGSIYIEGKFVDIGQNNLHAKSGIGGLGTLQGCGGDGGLGRIRVNAVTYKGANDPSQGIFTLGTMKNKIIDHSQPGQKTIDYTNTIYGNEVYRGCFKDEDVNHRILSFTVHLSADDKAKMTPEYCMSLCRKEALMYSATEYGYECFCDNHLNMDYKVADGDCNMPCRGDNLKTCGASFRAQVFGPPPEAPAEAHSAALQTCEPWCVTADPNPDNPDEQKWGLCSMNSQSIGSWSINCDCPEGYSGTGCTKPCTSGTYGKSCLQNCTCNMNNTAVCNLVTGNCQCKAGYRGLMCESTCPTGMFGTNCTGKCNCSHKAQCDKVNGACICKPGWYGENCQFLCPEGKYGYNCSQKCFCNDHGTCNPENIDGTCECTPGYKLPSCADPCDPGDYGPDCSFQCDCNGQPCDAINGVCKCNPGYAGKRCELDCPHGKYGLNCQYTCACAVNTDCNKQSGLCICGPGVVGQYCQDPCPEGSYGVDCQQRCNCVKNQTAHCEPTNGICYCKPGFLGENCGQPCPFGYYSDGCSTECSCMVGAPCNPMTGKCICPPGFTGQKCEMPCDSGHYGNQCKGQCPSCTSGAVCNRASGTCICQDGQSCQCPPGFWGQKCNSVCNCVHGTCNTAGICQCRSGWKGTQCDTPCPSGYYGLNCQMKCNCVHGLCHSDTGICICNAGYMGNNCSTSCPSGFFGPECKRSCPKCTNHALGSCDPQSGTCLCKAGFTGALCDQPCPDGFYGNSCSQKCSCNPITSYCRNTDGFCVCLDGYTGPTCSQQCSNFTWGPNCTNKCSCSNNTMSCNPKTGDCICKNGFAGVKCLHSCVNGFWGKECLNQCNCSKDGSDYCDPIDGSCQCKPGYQGQQCYTKCPSGRWGKGCVNICECNNHGVCDTNNGQCDCDPGYIGGNCEKVCKQDVYWGKRCANKCDCSDEECDPRDGTCRCPPGKKGYRCEIHCDFGYFGFQCAQPCLCKNDAVCDPVNGNCHCQPGWSGRFCDEPCPPGMYGVGCTETCPRCQNGASCDSELGVCKCLPGFMGIDCNQTCPQGSWGDLCQLKCPSVCKKGCQAQTGVCNCEDWTCRNGGICTDQGVCLCSGGFTGDDCTTYLGMARPQVQAHHTQTDTVALTTAQVAGIAIGVLFLVCLVFIMTVIYMRKRYTGRLLGTSGTIKYDGRQIEVTNDGGFSNPLHYDEDIIDNGKQSMPAEQSTSTEQPGASLNTISLDTSTA